MDQRSTASQESLANLHPSQGPETEMRLDSPALAGEGGSLPIPTLEELLEALDREDCWNSGQLRKGGDADELGRLDLA
jgi:hypothetical protein